MKRPLLAITLLIFLSGLVGVIVIRALSLPIVTPVAARHQHQLVYTKMNSNKGSLFVGDVYLLDTISGDITLLVQSGETGSRGWLSNGDHLMVYQRPRGSVIHDYILHVAAGDLSESDPSLSQNISNSILEQEQRSPDGQRLVVEVNYPDDTYVVMSMNTAQPQVVYTLENIEESSLRWLPDSETLFYQTQDAQACLTNVIQNETHCWTARYAALSHAVEQTRVAFSTWDGAQFSVLCVAVVEGIQLADQQCYDQHIDQILDLSWRP